MLTRKIKLRSPDSVASSLILDDSSPVTGISAGIIPLDTKRKILLNASFRLTPRRTSLIFQDSVLPSINSLTAPLAEALLYQAVCPKGVPHPIGDTPLFKVMYPDDNITTDNPNFKMMEAYLKTLISWDKNTYPTDHLVLWFISAQAILWSEINYIKLKSKFPDVSKSVTSDQWCSPYTNEALLSKLRREYSPYVTNEFVYTKEIGVDGKSLPIPISSDGSIKDKVRQGIDFVNENFVEYKVKPYSQLDSYKVGDFHDSDDYRTNMVVLREIRKGFITRKKSRVSAARKYIWDAHQLAPSLPILFSGFLYDLGSEHHPSLTYVRRFYDLERIKTRNRHFLKHNMTFITGSLTPSYLYADGGFGHCPSSLWPQLLPEAISDSKSVSPPAPNQGVRQENIPDFKGLSKTFGLDPHTETGDKERDKFTLVRGDFYLNGAPKVKVSFDNSDYFHDFKQMLYTEHLIMDLPFIEKMYDVKPKISPKNNLFRTMKTMSAPKSFWCKGDIPRVSESLSDFKFSVMHKVADNYHFTLPIYPTLPSQKDTWNALYRYTKKGMSLSDRISCDEYGQDVTSHIMRHDFLRKVYSDEELMDNFSPLVYWSKLAYAHGCELRNIPRSDVSFAFSKTGYGFYSAKEIYGFLDRDAYGKAGLPEFDKVMRYLENPLKNADPMVFGEVQLPKLRVNGGFTFKGSRASLHCQKIWFDLSRPNSRKSAIGYGCTGEWVYAVPNKFIGEGVYLGFDGGIGSTQSNHDAIARTILLSEAGFMRGFYNSMRGRKGIGYDDDIQYWSMVFETLSRSHPPKKNNAISVI